MNTRVQVVRKELKYDRKVYAPGDTVTMRDSHVKALVALGRVALPPPPPRPPRAAPEVARGFDHPGIKGEAGTAQGIKDAKSRPMYKRRDMTAEE